MRRPPTAAAAAAGGGGGGGGCGGGGGGGASVGGDGGEYECAPINGCGTSAGAAYLYFISFEIVVGFVFVNLFVAVILEGFEQSHDIEEGNKDVIDGDGIDGEGTYTEDDVIGLTEHEYRCFCDAWARVDPHLTWALGSDDLFKVCVIHVY